MTRTLLWLITTILTVGCSATKMENIIYLLDIDTEQSIYNEIKRTNFDFAFYVSSESDSTYAFKLIKVNDNAMVAKTNRRLFINDKSYPIFFESDYQFYSKTQNNVPIVAIAIDRDTEKEITIPSLKERSKKRDIYGRLAKYPLYHNYAYWIVDIHGETIETNTEP